MKPGQIAESFADQFEISFVKEPYGQLPTINVPRVANSVKKFNITGDMVQKALSSFDDGTATGPDDIPSILLKSCSQALTASLAQIMNKSLEEGALPDDWKVANVVPIYKKGNKLSPVNYRPISLTSILCKAMEKNIANKLERIPIARASCHKGAAWICAETISHNKST
ncbi:hypothetical protein PYW08_005845 [Mythimna loreyi]|uniref:Uncharacterized protein n=1 Tax=Mythimna loreyi TaxID=667449 RepID=A0ACC2QIX3_9NEOP|nr:hypothetical protein PYW08_005845 [Mythimna loreyi]